MRKILLVDALDLWRNLVRQIFLEDDYEVLEAGDCAEALRVARVSPPDVVLLDYELPDANAVEAARRLRCQPGCELVPIILLTATELSGDCMTPPVPFVSGYLDKRSATDELRACVGKHLRRNS